MGLDIEKIIDKLHEPKVRVTLSAALAAAELVKEAYEMLKKAAVDDDITIAEIRALKEDFAVKQKALQAAIDEAEGVEE